MTSTNEIKETDQPAYSLLQCAEKYYAATDNVDRADNQPTVTNRWLDQVDYIENSLQSINKQNGVVTTTDLALSLRNPDEAMTFIRQILDDDTLIRADSKYTFGQYREKRLPLLSSLLSTYRRKDVQDTVIRPIIIQLIESTIKGPDEIKANNRKILISTLQNLTQTNTPSESLMGT